MAFRITRDCVECGACLPKCENKAIMVNKRDEYSINPDRCTECVDLGRRRCYRLCQVNAIQPDPEHQETKAELWEKHRRLRLIASERQKSPVA